MSFLKSAVNQVGRDLGRVVSNQIFKDNHSIPLRNINNRRVSHNYEENQQYFYINEFSKAINFPTSHRPSTLINKIAGAYTIIKNTSNKFIQDGYLDTSESEQLFMMMQEFNQKIEDICDILEIDEVSNEKEINQLTTIVNKSNDVLKQTLQVSADGCKLRAIEHKEESERLEQISFWRYVWLNFIWMGDYARGGEKSILKTVFANISDVIFVLPLFITRPYLFLKGVFTYGKENKRRNTIKDAHQRLSDLENKRAETYLKMI